MHTFKVEAVRLPIRSWRGWNYPFSRLVQLSLVQFSALEIVDSGSKLSVF